MSVLVCSPAALGRFAVQSWTAAAVMHAPSRQKAKQQDTKDEDTDAEGDGDMARSCRVWSRLLIGGSVGRLQVCRPAASVPAGCKLCNLFASVDPPSWHTPLW